ncbi:MAG: type 4a pilus biogenesis protein PilO [Candidatus Eisenbacteria bacterium]|uniref:Type 4a pilus biogenesis protein PilO n=1 Tax=Eiseniibacteriota bacterium TaxID=2212470 RepID=A0A956LY19_UNCEI|nr:type 4a pilus biogenesis protein PilO [Candidatus Eisenbacteria bacterium]
MAIDVRDPRVQKIVLGAIGLGAVLYVYFFTTWAPFTYQANAAELRTLEERYRDLSKDLNKARQAIDRLPYLEKEYDLLQKKWEQGKALLPEDQEMVELLRQVTLLGTSTGVEFTLFKPLPPRPQTNYTELPIQITVAGSYHEVGAFLAEVSNMERIVNVSGILVETIEEREAREGQSATATFEAVAYRLGGAPPAPAVADATKGRRSTRSSKAAPKGRPSNGGGE